MLRVKPEKSKTHTQSCTLDEIHQRQMNTFKKMRESVDDKKRILNSKINELNKIENKDCKKLTQHDISKKMELKDIIFKLKKEISEISSGELELEYFSKTDTLLMEYYNMLENTGHVEIKNIEEMIMDNSPKKMGKRKKKSDDNQNNILTYFFQSENNVSPQKKVNVTRETISDSPPRNRSQIHKQYMSIINNDDEYMKNKYKDNTRYCYECNQERIIMASGGAYVCPECGGVVMAIIESDVPNYKESNTEKTSYPYKRLNHFIEWLNQFQAKESTDIPKEAYDMIMAELSHSRIRNVKNISVTRMKEILKKLGLHKYYEHIPSIISKISGKHPPSINRETEEQLKQMFRAIQEPFTKFCPVERTNFLSYSYVLHKFFQILNMQEFVERLPLLKSREKLRLQDKLWKQICEELNWTYYPSI